MQAVVFLPLNKGRGEDAVNAPLEALSTTAPKQREFVMENIAGQDGFDCIYKVSLAGAVFHHLSKNFNMDIKLFCFLSAIMSIFCGQLPTSSLLRVTCTPNRGFSLTMCNVGVYTATKVTKWNEMHLEGNAITP